MGTERPVGPNVPRAWERAGSGGPRPFTSWISYRRPQGTCYLWESRHSRKGAGPVTATGRAAPHTAEAESSPNPWLQLWAPQRLAWWIALIFLVGSLLFIAGAAGSLAPSAFGGQHRMAIYAESCYFLGALLYTVSVYGQVFESLNADDRVGPDGATHAPHRYRWFGFEPGKLSFWTPFVLLIGSLTFNYETTFAVGAKFELLPKAGLWWTSLIGSVLFLVSSLLQLAEAGHGYLKFDPRDVSCWVGLLFVLGSIGFIVGSLPGFPDTGFPTAENPAGASIVKVGFLAGGVAFLLGSYLMLPELFIQLRSRDRRS
ncbi:hypothetical protein E1202_15985 [Saccharopolyspora karakumensis]|uniref:YrhK-like protein n=1 Tax=Saccharopolyspora karakumensis TaxID=2530386 RepID=A0A4R5BU99_9PSEU|nr:hypothetical protein E1202_15985 [Saccharopolyspora karakumensis]